MTRKTESNKLKKRLFDSALILLLFAQLALLIFLIHIDRHDMKIFFAGCIWNQSYLNLLLIWGGLVVNVLSRLPALRNTTDASARKKLKKWIRFTGIWCVLFAAYIVYDTADNIRQNMQACIAEIHVDTHDSILLVEKYDILSSGSQYHDITVYQRHGITIKRIDYIYESGFQNSSMIADNLYTWECDDNTVTIQFDYGGLQEGRKWADDELNLAPPDYIEMVYEIHS